MTALARAVATGLGSGYSPVAPGTAGSVLGLLLFWPLAGRPLALQLVAFGSLVIVGVAAAGHTARRAGRGKDPRLIVVDEVVGMWASLLWLPFTPSVAVVAFLAFRVLDVWKPWPARQLESLPGGWGIVGDDLMAGVYANLLTRALLVAWTGP